MRVLVATPTYGGTVWDESADSVANACIGAVAEGHEVVKGSVRGYGCGPARTAIADRALDGGFDHVLMVDDDIVVPDGALVRMLSHGVDVCLGYYARQGRFDGVTCLYRKGGEGFKDPYTTDEVAEMRDGGAGLFEVKGGGFGCALVSTSVFARMQRPYFKWVDYANGTHLSEDLYFCLRCRDLGVRVHADAAIGCGHFFRYRQDSM